MLTRLQYKQLESAVSTFLSKLHTDDRVTVVANYYRTRVRVGFTVDSNSVESVVTSAHRDSPVSNVVCRLSL